MQRYYIVTDYIPHSVHFIPVTHLFCNWKFVPINLNYQFPPHKAIPYGNHLFFSLHLIALFLYFYVCSFVFFFRFRISEIVQYLFFSALLISHNVL